MTEEQIEEAARATETDLGDEMVLEQDTILEQDGAEVGALPEHLEFENAHLSEGWESVPRSYARLESETHRTTGRMWRAMSIAVLILLFLNADRLSRMVQSLPVGSWADTTIVMSEAWDEEMHKHELTDISTTIRANVEAFQDANWDDVTSWIGSVFGTTPGPETSGVNTDEPLALRGSTRNS